MVNQEIKKILIIKWGALGDLIASTPAIKALRNNYPDARITLLTNPLMIQIIPEGFLVDDHIIINTNRNKVIDSVSKQLLTAFRLRRKKFDLAVNLRWTSERAALLTYLSGAKVRISSGPEKLMNLYTVRLKHPTGRYHEIHRNLDIVKGLGLNIEDENPTLYLSGGDKKFADDFFNSVSISKKNTICIHPGASREIRAWLPDRFAEIGKRLVKEFDSNIVVTWSGSESALADRIVSEIGKNAYKAPATESIGRLAALIENCGLFFSNCTGPMNVSVAVKTPVVALLGSSDPTDWGAYGREHINIKSPLVLEHYSDESEHEAMKAILVDSVWNIVQSRWKELSGNYNQSINPQ